ncbi:MAG TPA: PIN domain-containing protein [Candidatus Binatia bacterium]
MFLDSGVLIEGLLSSWSASRGVLILGRCGLFRIVLANDVRREVEENLTDLLSVEPVLADEAIATYDKLLRLLNPEWIGATSDAEVERHRHLIRHAADVPILVAALKARPTWLVTTNTRHFNGAVAARTGLQICTPHHLIARIHVLR